MQSSPLLLSFISVLLLCSAPSLALPTMIPSTPFILISVGCLAAFPSPHPPTPPLNHLFLSAAQYIGTTTTQLGTNRSAQLTAPVSGVGSFVACYLDECTNFGRNLAGWLHGTDKKYSNPLQLLQLLWSQLFYASSKEAAWSEELNPISSSEMR